MKKILTKIGLWSVFKISFIIGLIFGLFIGAIYALIFGFAGGLAIISGDEEAAVGGLVLIIVGLVMLIVISSLYAIFSGVSCVISAFIYNIIVKFVGGIEVEFEDKIRYSNKRKKELETTPPKVVPETETFTPAETSQEKKVVEHIYCQKCGIGNKTEHSYCRKCGAKLRKE